MPRRRNGGCHNLAVVPVQSLLKAVGAAEQRYSIELGEAVIHESKLELICEDHQADGLVSIIELTGQAEAGWIVVTDIVQVILIGGMHE